MDYEDFEGVDDLTALRGCLITVLFLLAALAVIGLAILATVIL